MKDKILLIVESPHKAKTISKYLGKEYIICASQGHIFDLATDGPHNYGIDVGNGFKPKYQIIPDKKDKVKAILKSAEQAKEILIASDPDREGEAIACHLAEILKKFGVPIKRVLFYELIKEEILRAVNSPRELDFNLYDAQQARRVLDRIVGFSVSPYLINKFNQKLSAGRVQSVAVRLVVDREKEIKEFKPDEYWNINVTLSKSDAKDKFIAKYSNKVTDQKTAQKIKDDLLKDTFSVSDVKEVEKLKKPFPPLITYSLAAISSGSLHFPAAKTMQLAQKLYEAGLITYMRTDSVRTSNEAIEAARGWLADNNHDVPNKPNIYTNKDGAAQDAHEAIRPTDITKLPSEIYLPDDEKKVYKLIWERFIASQMNPAIYDTMDVTILSSSDHKLKAHGKSLKYKGWLEIVEDFDDNDSDVKLPRLEADDVVKMVPPNVKAEQKKTQPPPRYSEKTLIEELKKKGIGRPSTYVAIVSKITDRNYIERKANSFIPTDIGMKISDLLVNQFKFMDYTYTSEMEEKLDKIADGNLKYVDMLNEFYNPFRTELKEAALTDENDYGKCELCGTSLALKHGRFGYFLSCCNYPDCKFTISCDVIDGKMVHRQGKPPVDESVKCDLCGHGMMKKYGKFGEFYSCSNFPSCRATKKAPCGKKCPDCGKDLYATTYKEDSVLFCTGYPECKYKEVLPKGSVLRPEDVSPSAKLSKQVKKVLKK